MTSATLPPSSAIFRQGWRLSYRQPPHPLEGLAVGGNHDSGMKLMRIENE